MRYFLLLILLVISPEWGFFAHKKINYLAVFTLPPSLFPFYKKNIAFIEEEAVAPDKRRYVIKQEGSRHYIDLDYYDSIPSYHWQQAEEQYSGDSLRAHGVLPWHLYLLSQKLTTAFLNKDHHSILRLSADVGHYIADAHVPLHTVSNYNGQFTDQEGIHGFWESRLPELFSGEYNFLTGRAEYIPNIKTAMWNTVISSFNLSDSVLKVEKRLSQSISPDKKFSFEERGNSLIKVFSEGYSRRYHTALHGMVERQMRKAVKLTGSFWYTCWVNAGQPVLIQQKPFVSDSTEKTPPYDSDHLNR